MSESVDDCSRNLTMFLKLTILKNCVCAMKTALVTIAYLTYGALYLG